MKTLKIFTASWCQPCQQLKKVVKELSYPEDLNIVTVDIESWKDEVIEANIRSVPTTILLINGEEVARKTGMMSEEALRYFLDKDYSFASKT